MEWKKASAMHLLDLNAFQGHNFKHLSDLATFMRLDWTLVTGSLARQLAFLSLLAMAGSLAAAIGAMLAPSRPAAAASEQPTATATPAVAQPEVPAEQAAEPRLAAVGARGGLATPVAADERDLDRSRRIDAAAAACGLLTPTDLIALAALRRRIERGDVAEGPTTPQRAAFARWLVEHGRLTG